MPPFISSDPDALSLDCAADAAAAAPAGSASE